MYIGVKLVEALSMNRAAYVKYRGWELPADEDGADEGFLVEYIDGGKVNHPAHKGFISWSPADVFENAYRRINKLTFGLAIESLKAGKKVAREGWNGKGMFLFLTNNIDFTTDADLSEMADFEGDLFEGDLTHDSIVMKTADNRFVVGWLASQTDMLADDWMIVD